MSESNNEPKKRGRPVGSKSKGATQKVETITEVNQSAIEEKSFSYEYNSSIPVSISMGDTVIDCPVDLGMISEYKESPMIYHRELRKLSWWAYRTNGAISSGLDYMRSMHTLDKVVYCSTNNISESFKKRKNVNKKKFESTLSTIKYKKFIRDALLKDFNDGIIFYYFETTTTPINNQKYLSDIDVLNIFEINELGINASIVALPTEYCRIIGKVNGSYKVAFDMRYFSQFAGENRARKLKAFPKEIRDGWDKYDNGKQIQPWIALNNDNTICHKIKSADSEPWGVPLPLSALDDILYANHFINTKRNILDDLNNQIFYETYPEGEKKGSSSLSQTQQKDQHDMIKGALFNNSNRYGKAFFSLATGTKLDQIKVDTSIFDEKNETNVKNNVSQDIGIEASIVGGESSANFATATLNIECIASSIFAYISDIVDELNKVINATIIKDSSCLTKMAILPTTFVNRDKMVKYMSDLYARGKGSLQAWISSTGIEPDCYIALMEEELENDWENKFPVHKTSFTMSGKDLEDSDVDQSGGRPKTTSNNNDNTVQSKTVDSNNMPKPSV